MPGSISISTEAARAAMDEDEREVGPILIVDDVEDQRDLLGISLRRAGFRVAYAEDGEDAWTRLESGLRPSLIILDLAMPRMDGFAFRERQLADARLRGIPVVVVSAVADRRHVGPELGAPTIAKPFELDAVLGAVAQAMAGRRGSPAR
jgi:chemosensory pili system protein ChpA (sensor histidine kinase/response regulator)